jgi:hypothetical protein
MDSLQEEVEKEKQRLLIALIERHPSLAGFRESSLNKFDIALSPICPACNTAWKALYEDIETTLDSLQQFTQKLVAPVTKDVDE